eukprot:6459304-Amphidinium_carterae.1
MQSLTDKFRTVVCSAVVVKVFVPQSLSTGNGTTSGAISRNQYYDHYRKILRGWNTLEEKFNRLHLKSHTKQMFPWIYVDIIEC